jgi:hypothetical protein
MSICRTKLGERAEPPVLLLSPPWTGHCLKKMIPDTDAALAQRYYTSSSLFDNGILGLIMKIAVVSELNRGFLERRGREAKGLRPPNVHRTGRWQVAVAH